MSDQRARFSKTLDALEEQLDKGFFLSFINKIIVDEKRIYTIINELRSMIPDSFSGDSDGARAGAGRGYAESAPQRESYNFSPPAPRETIIRAADDGVSEKEALAKAEKIISDAMGEAMNIRAGADEYARKVLQELEDKLAKALKVVGEGKRVLEGRLDA